MIPRWAPSIRVAVVAVLVSTGLWAAVSAVRFLLGGPFAVPGGWWFAALVWPIGHLGSQSSRWIFRPRRGAKVSS